MLQENYNKLELEIKEIIKEYHQDVKTYIQTQNTAQSIINIINLALKNTPENISPKVIENTDKLVFPDIHGQLDLFIQNLYIANVVDNNGLPKSSTRNAHSIIQLGDAVDFGKYQLETLLYLRLLKKPLEEKGLSLKLLIGNHEFFLINSEPKESERNTMRSIIIDDILKNKMKVCHADDRNNILFIHAGMQKKNLIKVLIDMSFETKYKEKLEPVRDELNKLLENLHRKKGMEPFRNSEELKKISEEVASKRIYNKYVYEKDLKLSDIAGFVNDKFKEKILEIKNTKKLMAKDDKFGYLFADKQSLLFTRKKGKNNEYLQRANYKGEDFLPDKNDKKYSVKPIQIVGHVTTNQDKIKGYGVKGGVKQHNVTIFLDAGLTCGEGTNHTFLAMKSQNAQAYAVEIIDKNKNIGLPGLDTKNEPINLDRKKENIRARKLHLGRE